MWKIGDSGEVGDWKNTFVQQELIGSFSKGNEGCDSEYPSPFHRQDPDLDTVFTAPLICKNASMQLHRMHTARPVFNR